MDIKPNSHRSKEQQATSIQKETVREGRLKPIIPEGKARIQKKGAVSKFASAMISEDAQNVKSYILMDVLIPSFKKAISDIVTNGIDIILYGEAGRAKRNNAGRVSYRNFYDVPNDRFKSSGKTDYGRRTPGDTKPGRESVSLFEDVAVDTRGEAEDILCRMSEYLESFPVISVADMYDLAGITNFSHTYNNYGWRSVADAKVIRIDDGYVIKMPPVESIK